jgi:hypothetical protein
MLLFIMLCRLFVTSGSKTEFKENKLYAEDESLSNDKLLLIVTVDLSILFDRLRPSMLFSHHVGFKNTKVEHESCIQAAGFQKVSTRKCCTKTTPLDGNLLQIC